MDNDIRWKQRFQNFENAYNTMCRTLKRYRREPEDEVVRIALVQTFEFTFELAWNTMKDFLENEGFVRIGSSKQVIRTAFQAGIITEGEKWMSVVQKRNLASHTYNQIILNETVQYIVEEFYPLVNKLYEDFKSRL